MTGKTLEATQADRDFGKIAIQNELLTEEQLDEALATLARLRERVQGKKKVRMPRLVDVLVQKAILDGRQAASVEKARRYREVRLADKLYGRIAIKSKFLKPRAIERALEAQKKAYVVGEDEVRLSTWLVAKEHLTAEQDGAIVEAMKELDREEYLPTKAAAKPAPEQEKGEKKGSDEEIVVEELLDLADPDSEPLNLDDALELADVDSEIDLDLEELDDELEKVSESSAAKVPARVKPGKAKKAKS